MITCESCDKTHSLQVDGFENGRIEITDLKNYTDYGVKEENQSASIIFFPHSGPVTSISFGSIDEVPCFITTGADGKLIFWKNLKDNWTSKVLFRSEIPITSGYFSCDSSLIAFANQEGVISFINTDNEEFMFNEKLQFSTEKYGIHQVCFMLFSAEPEYVEILAIIDPDGELKIYKKLNGKNGPAFSEKPFTYPFSKSYVKSIAPLDRCYIAGICFGNIVRIFDVKMFSLSEINLKVGLSQVSSKDKISFINDFPIYALRWQEPLRKLEILEQCDFQIDQMKGDIEIYIKPNLHKKKHIFIKNPLGEWIEIEQNDQE